MSEGNRELEALIFASAEPRSAGAIRKALPKWTPSQIAEAVAQINAELLESGRPYEIAEVSGGYQFRTRPEFGPLLAAAQPERRVRLSKAALETLAIIAYRQPITRAEVEDLRCVDCGAVIRTLLERGLLRIVGRRDVPGRPVLYGTTSTFLQTFSLPSLRDMPSLREVQAMEEDTGTPGDTAGDEQAPPEGEPDDGATDVAAAASVG